MPSLYIQNINSRAQTASIETEVAITRERYRKQRSSKTQVPSSIKAALQKQQARIERAIQQQVNIEKNRRRRAAMAKHANEFDEFLQPAEVQGLTDWLPSEAFRAVGSVVTTPVNNIGRIVDALDRGASAAESIANTAHNTVDGISSFFDVNKTKLMSQIALAVGTVAIAPKFSIVILEILKILVGYTTVFDNITDTFQRLWPCLQNMLSWALGKARPQGSIDAGSVVEAEVQSEFMDYVPDKKFLATSAALAAGAGTLLGASLLTGTTSTAKDMAYKAYQRAASNLAAKKAEASIEGFMDSIILFIKKGFMALFPKGTFCDFVEEWLHNEKIDVKAFVTRCNRILDPVRRNQILYSKETGAELNTLCVQAMQIEDQIMIQPEFAKTQQMVVIRKCIKDILSFALIYQNSHVQETRHTPFSIMLFSKPGVGKSVITDCFIKTLSDPRNGCKMPFDQENLVYSRSSSDAYYSNYRQQSWFSCDDWAQSKQTTPTQSEYRDYISMISATPWSPPQASLADKGMPFTSLACIATTNNPYPCPTEIVEPTALHRRRAALIEVVLANPSAPLEDVKGRYAFILHDRMTQKPLHSDSLSFNQVCKYLVQKMNLWYEKNCEIVAIGAMEVEDEPLPLIQDHTNQLGTVGFTVPQIQNKFPGAGSTIGKTSSGCNPVMIPASVQSDVHEGPILPHPQCPFIADEGRQLNYGDEIRARTRFVCSEADHILFNYNADLQFYGQRVLATLAQNPEKYPAAKRCKCCGAFSCDQDLPERALCCVYHPSPEISHWNEVNYINFWQAIIEKNAIATRDAELGVIGKSWYRWCHERKVLYRIFQEGTIEYRMDCVLEEKADDEEVYQLFEELFYQEYNVYCGENVRESMKIYFNWMLEPPSPPVEVVFDEEMEIVEPQVVHDEWSWTDASDEENGFAEVQGGSSDYVGGRRNLDGSVDVNFYDAVTENALESAREEDEAVATERFFTSDTIRTGAKWTLKAILTVSTIFLTYKSLEFVRNYFKIGQTKQKVIGTIELPNGLIEQIVEKYPPSYRQILGSVIQAAIIGVSSGRLSAIYELEGSAGAYGEAGTIKAIRRQNVKFFNNVRKAAAEAAIAGGVEPWHQDSAKQVAELQGCSDLNGLEFINNKFGPKCLISLIRDGTAGEDHRSSKIKGVGLVGRLIAFPWHFVPQVPTVLETTVKTVQRTHLVSIDYTKAVRVTNGTEELDLALIELDNSVESFPDILHHFVRESELKKLERFKSMLVKHQTEAGGYYTSSNYIDTTSITSTEDWHTGFGYTYGNEHTGHYTLLKGFEYKVPTQKGDCGAMLVALDASLTGRICGFHVAGISSQEKGLSSPITFEVLENNIKQHYPKLVRGAQSGPTHAEIMSLSPEEALDKATIIPGGEIELHGVMLPSLAQRFPTKVDIIPTPVAGKIFPVTKGPAVLSGKDPRIDYTQTPEDYTSPMAEGFKKYEVPVKPFPADHVQLACDLLREKLMAHRIKKNLLSEHEMINGSPSIGLVGTDMSTSPGAPWKNMRPQGSKGKHFLFTQDEEGLYHWDFERTVVGGENPATHVRNAMLEWERCARLGQDVPFAYNYENLKQETVSQNKIKTGKTRLFSCAPLHLNLLYRKYFGSFIALMNSNAAKLPSAIGINPTGGDWTFLANRLRSQGDCMIAGDYQKWDGRLNGAVMGKVVEQVINPMYQKLSDWTHEDDVVRMRLVEYAIHTFTCVGNSLAQKHQGMPSGLPITGDLNSPCNVVYLICSFIECLEKHQRCDNCREVKITDFFKNNEVTVYGDDHVVSVGPECRCFYNFNKVRDVFSSHNIGYTDARKRGGVCPDFEKLEEVSYLKRGFVKEGALYKAPLEMDSVLEQINWMKDKLPPVEATLVNAQTIMREMVQHGSAAYNETRDRINIGLRALQDEVLETSSDSFEVPIFSYALDNQKWRDECV
jgi:hypothetical protein